MGIRHVEVALSSVVGLGLAFSNHRVDCIDRERESSYRGTMHGN
jgi:hypothetical protein